MGRAPCCSKVGLHRGPWTPREDTLLTKYIQSHGEGHWRSLPKKAGLLRCGKSCRLRWMNYLRPDIKRGNITPDEDELIIRMHSLLGNRWSLIAGRLPGRTDNEIKNYWNTHLSKKLRSQGTDPNTHKKLLVGDDHGDDQPNKEESGNKKRKNVTNSSKKKKKTNNNNNSKGKLVEPVKPKVHLPKPVRLSLPRNDSFECITFNSNVSSSQGGEGSRGIEAEVPWSDINHARDSVDSGNNNHSNNDHMISGVNFLVGDDHYLVNGPDDLECDSINVPTGNNLEKLYEEYWQLLKTDDDEVQMLDIFPESLLI